jgi:uncharacterized protein (TIGR02271 family)
MEREERGDSFTALEERFTGYEVYDRNGERLGQVDDLFIDEHDQPEYIGVKMGFLGTRSTLIPIEIARIQESWIEVPVDKSTAKNAPAFDYHEEITPDYEERVRSHYGLGGSREPADRRGAYDNYYGDEVRVQRSEEELVAGTREREAGILNVRKRVRTDREQVRVPTRHEEVSVERVPVEGQEASEAEIGDDEVSVPVVEEEVVVEKRPVVKEELRIRKDVVQDEELVEDDVRREEVEIEGHTERGTGLVDGKSEIGDQTKRRSR